MGVEQIDVKVALEGLRKTASDLEVRAQNGYPPPDPDITEIYDEHEVHVQTVEAALKFSVGDVGEIGEALEGLKAALVEIEDGYTRTPEQGELVPFAERHLSTVQKWVERVRLYPRSPGQVAMQILRMEKEKDDKIAQLTAERDQLLRGVDRE